MATNRSVTHVQSREPKFKSIRFMSVDIQMGLNECHSIVIKQAAPCVAFFYNGPKQIHQPSTSIAVDITS